LKEKTTEGVTGAKRSVGGSGRFTDLALGREFVDQYADRVRYCPAWKKWFIWDGTVWKKDDCCEIHELLTEFIRGMRRTVASGGDYRKALERQTQIFKCESLRRREAILMSAQLEKSIKIDPIELDQDPFLFNTLNGTIDLRTGELKEPMQTAFLTKCASVRFERGAAHPEWDRFLFRVMAGNARMVSFLQKAIGWTLTGDMSEQAMFILFGTGANGKSTFLNVVTEILGNYAKTAQPESFMKKRGESISNDIARLCGTRFVTTHEIEEGQRLSETLIKQITGQDLMTARFLYGEYFEFLPTFKVFMATNQSPAIRGNDYGIWRRIKVIPFPVQISGDERDPELMDKLRAEKSGILNWMLEGCLLWQKEGLGEPEEMRTAITEYREDMDIVNSFLGERCETEGRASAKTPSGELYAAFVEWCRKAGEEPYSQRMFSIYLESMGFRKGRDSKKRYWKGIVLRHRD
jgi:putative DNA primase/helicase